MICISAISSESSGSSFGPETDLNFEMKPCQLVLIEDRNNNDFSCLIFHFSLIIHLINKSDQTKISATIKDLAFFGSNFQQLKESKMKYSVIIKTL